METRKINTPQLGRYVRAKRMAAGLGVRQLARAARVDPTWVSRLEHGDYVEPGPRHLAAVAGALDLEVSDLYLAAGYPAGVALPGLEPYLRAKYDLPQADIDQLTAHFELINERYTRERTEGGSHDGDHH